jgi:hypothetical protein
LGATNVKCRAGAPVGFDARVDGEMDDRVDTAEPVGDRRVADVEQLPGDTAEITTMIVDRDDLAYSLVRRQRGRERAARLSGGTGDGHGEGGSAASAGLPRT